MSKPMTGYTRCPKCGLIVYVHEDEGTCFVCGKIKIERGKKKEDKEKKIIWFYRPAVGTGVGIVGLSDVVLDGLYIGAMKPLLRRKEDARLNVLGDTVRRFGSSLCRGNYSSRAFGCGNNSLEVQIKFNYTYRR